MPTEEIVKSVSISPKFFFNFNKENILKLISFIATFAIFSFFVLFFISNLQSNKLLVNWNNIFNFESVSNQSFNFLVLGHFVIYLIIIGLSLYKSISVIQKNNFKFTHYIYWYVSYLLLSVIGASMIFVAPINQEFRPYTFFYKSMIVLAYFILNLAYEIHVLAFKYKRLIVTKSLIIIFALEHLLKAILIILGYVCLHIFLNSTQSNNSLFFNNNLVERINFWKTEKPGIYFAIILATTMLIISIIIVDFIKYQKQRESIIAKKQKISNTLAFWVATLISVFASSVYSIVILSKNNLLISNDNYDYLYLAILIISFVAFGVFLAVHYLVVIKRTNIGVKNWVRNFVNISYILILFLLLINSLLINSKTQQISSLFLIALLISHCGFVLKNKHHFDTITMSSYLLGFLLGALGLFVNVFEFATLSLGNNSMIYLTKNIFYSAQLTIAALVIVFVNIIRKSLSKITILFVWLTISKFKKISKGDKNA
ncbi:MSC_0624 family F1-like ATPase-associated membrane protein [Mycoplasmopsis columboralis]|uniref:MSC_0624 family F1-like ATPase-associated membrane protein n=1 Tax=Mycoplasmopsis columboralis TaxID=171282 RepID=UPI0038CD679D